MKDIGFYAMGNNNHEEHEVQGLKIFFFESFVYFVV